MKILEQKFIFYLLILIVLLTVNLVVPTQSKFSYAQDERVLRYLQEIDAELAVLGARIDNLESRVAFLEDNFSR